MALVTDFEARRAWIANLRRYKPDQEIWRGRTTVGQALAEAPADEVILNGRRLTVAAALELTDK